LTISQARESTSLANRGAVKRFTASAAAVTKSIKARAITIVFSVFIVILLCFES
jgi:hypothetical protein